MDSITKDLENLALKSSKLDSNNNNNNTSNNGKWRGWRFKCNDLRVYKESAQTSDTKKQFNAKTRQIREERETQGIPIHEASYERWPLHWTEDVLYENEDVMLKAVEEDILNGGQFSSSSLAKKTYFDKMLGFGLFRAHFKPFVYDAIFRAQLYCFAGDHQVLTKFDGILLKTLIWVKELPEELAESVQGIMLRSEINPGTKLANVVEPYKDEGNLPCRFKLDVWITNKSKSLDVELFAKIRAEIAEIKQTMEFPCYTYYKQSDQWGLQIYECPDLRMNTNEFYDGTTDVSEYYTKIRQIRAEREAQGIPVFEESRDRWPLYLKEAVRYENMEAMLAAFKQGIKKGGPFSCRTLAEKTYYDKMHGFGFFRGPFKPFIASHSSTRYRAFFYCFARDQFLLSYFDRILRNTMRLVTELPKELAKCVNGIMLRAEINPGKKLTKSQKRHKDEGNLPYRFRLELWIAKNSKHGERLQQQLIAKIEANIKTLKRCNFDRLHEVQQKHQMEEEGDEADDEEDDDDNGANE